MHHPLHMLQKLLATSLPTCIDNTTSCLGNWKPTKHLPLDAGCSGVRPQHVWTNLVLKKKTSQWITARRMHYYWWVVVSNISYVHIYYVHPFFGEIIHFDYYLFHGLKPPPRLLWHRGENLSALFWLLQREVSVLWLWAGCLENDIVYDIWDVYIASMEPSD